MGVGRSPNQGCSVKGKKINICIPVLDFWMRLGEGDLKNKGNQISRRREGKKIPSVENSMLHDRVCNAVRYHNIGHIASLQ